MSTNVTSSLHDAASDEKHPKGVIAGRNRMQGALSGDVQCEAPKSQMEAPSTQCVGSSATQCCPTLGASANSNIHWCDECEAIHGGPNSTQRKLSTIAEKTEKEMSDWLEPTEEELAQMQARSFEELKELEALLEEENPDLYTQNEILLSNPPFNWVSKLKEILEDRHISTPVYRYDVRTCTPGMRYYACTCVAGEDNYAIGSDFHPSKRIAKRQAAMLQCFRLEEMWSNIARLETIEKNPGPETKNNGAHTAPASAAKRAQMRWRRVAGNRGAVHRDEDLISRSVQHSITQLQGAQDALEDKKNEVIDLEQVAAAAKVRLEQNDRKERERVEKMNIIKAAQEKAKGMKSFSAFWIRFPSNYNLVFITILLSIGIVCALLPRRQQVCTQMAVDVQATVDKIALYLFPPSVSEKISEGVGWFTNKPCWMVTTYPFRWLFFAFFCVSVVYLRAMWTFEYCRWTLLAIQAPRYPEGGELRIASQHGSRCMVAECIATYSVFRTNFWTFRTQEVSVSVPHFQEYASRPVLADEPDRELIAKQYGLSTSIAQFSHDIEEPTNTVELNNDWQIHMLNKNYRLFRLPAYVYQGLSAGLLIMTAFTCMATLSMMWEYIYPLCLKPIAVFLLWLCPILDIWAEQLCNAVWVVMYAGLVCLFLILIIYVMSRLGALKELDALSPSRIEECCAALVDLCGVGLEVILTHFLPRLISLLSIGWNALTTLYGASWN